VKEIAEFVKWHCLQTGQLQARVVSSYPRDTLGMPAR
jgi:hypothetical protein